MDLPDPAAGTDKVLIDVADYGLNLSGQMIRIGTDPYPLPYPMIPGLEGSRSAHRSGPGCRRYKTRRSRARLLLRVQIEGIDELNEARDVRACIESRHLSGKLLLRVPGMS
jgi:hypothetical protein